MGSPIPSKRALTAFSGLVLLAVVALPKTVAAAQSVVQWEYRVDSATKPPLDEDGWLPLREDSWRALPESGRAWLRSRLPQGPWTDESLLLERHFVSAEVWLEGEPGPFVHRPRQHDSILWRLIRLEPGTEGKRIFVRVGPSGLRLAATGAPVTLGNRVDLVVSLVSSSVPRAVIALTSLALALASLLVFLRRREQRTYLYFALFGLAEGLILFVNTDARQLVGGADPVWTILRLGGRALSPPMLVAFLATVLRVWPGLRLARWASWTAVLSLAWLALDVVAHAQVHQPMLYWINAELFVGSALSIAIVVTAARRTERAWFLLVALLFSAGVAVHERLFQQGFISGHTWTGWAHLALLVAIGDRLLREFTGIYEQLQREVQSRDEFLSIASHELRNPLAVIAADAALLARTERQAPVEEIQRQVNHLTRLVDDLLEVSRVKRGTLTLRVEPLALSPVVRSALASMRHAADARGVRLELEAEAGTIWVAADRVRLDQMICNVVRNAIQHTPEGGRVTVSVEQQAPRAVIRIADTGEGMTPATMAKLFQFFQRGDRSPLEQGEGMGVGLALVKQLAELHGGTISAHSDGPGKGSTFTLKLPCCEASAVEADSRDQEPVPSAIRAPASVLLVDDNANLRKTMRLLLEQSGFTVAEAGDGQEGLDQLLTGSYDAAVVDLRMPQLDGLEVARRVRASPTASTTRLVALTGFGKPEDKETARQAGFDHVLVKPANPEQLAQLLSAPRA